MNTIGIGIGRAWDALSDGWSHLRERAGSALTRFRSGARGGHAQLQTRAEQAAEAGARWALLAGEVRDLDDAVSVSLEVPGMREEDFDIDVQGDRLVVRGEKHVRREHQEGRYYLMECAYGRFERIVPLPAPVTDQGAQAHYRRGVLTITLPKRLAARRRRITVTTGKTT